MPAGEGRTDVDVTALPFNRLLGLEPSDPDSGFLVSLPGLPQYTNHVGTVHASALLAVAEAGSGAFLLRHFRDAAGWVPVVRRIEAKFRKPAHGRVSARASAGGGELERAATDLAARGRTLVRVSVEVVDAGGTVAMTADVEWFIARDLTAGNHIR
jgi:acyl-coenzyme A thioesterase PaaI-like protein